jgi:hypothetical protein
LWLRSDLAPLGVTCYNLQMLHVRNVILETTLEAAFAAPIPFDSASLKGVASKALEKFSKYELQHNQVIQRIGDQLFDYHLFFSLFNNQANVRLTSDRLIVRVQGAKNNADTQILGETLLLSVQCIDSPIKQFTIHALAHATFVPESEGVKYFEAFTDNANHIVEGGRIAVVKQPDWETTVRISVEKSLFAEGGVFLVWKTEHSGTVSLESLKIIADKFDRAAKSVGLEYRIE